MPFWTPPRMTPNGEPRAKGTDEEAVSGPLPRFGTNGPTGLSGLIVAPSRP